MSIRFCNDRVNPKIIESKQLRSILLLDRSINTQSIPTTAIESTTITSLLRQTLRVGEALPWHYGAAIAGQTLRYRQRTILKHQNCFDDYRN